MILRLVRGAFGVGLLLVGGIFLLQGIGVLPGSTMTGSGFWAGVGLALVALALWLLLGQRRGPKPRP